MIQRNTEMFFANNARFPFTILACRPRSFASCSLKRVWTEYRFAYAVRITSMTLRRLDFYAYYTQEIAFTRPLDWTPDRGVTNYSSCQLVVNWLSRNHSINSEEMTQFLRSVCFTRIRFAQGSCSKCACRLFFRTGQLHFFAVLLTRNNSNYITLDFAITDCHCPHLFTVDDRNTG